MASTSRASPDDDGYKRFTEDVHNVSYGSNYSSKMVLIVLSDKIVSSNLSQLIF